MTGENAVTATITAAGSAPAASNITTTISTEPTGPETEVQYVVVALGGTAPTVETETTYTLTLTIPQDGYTPKDGYIKPDGALTKTYTFTVKPEPTTTPITITAKTDTLTISNITDGKIANDLEIEFTVTGGTSWSGGSGITVVASQGSYEHTFTDADIKFTEPTSGRETGTLKITLTGCTAPDLTRFTSSGGFTVTIPKETFKPLQGYDMPDGNWTFNEFKLVISAQTGGE